MHQDHRPSDEAIALIVAVAEQALATAPRELTGVERAALVAAGPDAPWPELIRRTTRLNTLHWLTSTIRHPRHKVLPSLSSEQMASIGAAADPVPLAQILGVFRASQEVACAVWIGGILAYGAPAAVTAEALSVSLASINAFVDATVLEIDRLAQEASRSAASDASARRAALVAAFIDDPGQDAHATSCGRRIGYALDGPHHAAILWRADGEAGMAPLREMATAIVGDDAHAPQSLLVDAENAVWIWSRHEPAGGWPAGRSEAGFRLAIGPQAEGPAGFRRTHLLARDLRRLMARTNDGRAIRRWVDEADLTLVQADRALLGRYVAAMLGELANGDRADHQLLLDYLSCGCNVAECARRTGLHRNTVARHVGSFGERLGLPVARNATGIALALRLRLAALG